MKALRTPDEQFANLPGYGFEPHYTQITDSEGGVLRVHHVDEGPADGEVIVCLHGQPTWSYFYRHIIPILAGAGYRVIAPDYVGFGRSDKPTEMSDYSVERHVSWMLDWLLRNDLKDVTLYGHGWGGILGPRLVATCPERFARVIVSSTALFDGFNGLPEGGELRSVEEINAIHAAFNGAPVLDDMWEVYKAARGEGDYALPGAWYFRKFASENEAFKPSDCMAAALGYEKDKPQEWQATLGPYDAPYPSREYMAGARVFPLLAQAVFDCPDIANNVMAWKELSRFEKPFLTLYGEHEVYCGGLDKMFQDRIPGAKGQKHAILKGASDYALEQVSEEMAEHILAFIADNPR